MVPRRFKASDNLTPGIDADGLSESGAWRIDRGEGAIAQHKPVHGAARIMVAPHDVAAGVDVEGFRERGSRMIDRGEGALVEQKAMRGSRSIDVDAHDLTRSVDPERTSSDEHPGNRWS